MINKRSRVGVVAALSAAALALSACGGSGSASESGDDSTLRVGVNHWVANTEMKIGMEQGFFEDEGIDTVELEPLGPPPTIIAALQSKKIDIGVIPTVDYLTALSQNLKLTAVAPLTGYGETPADWEKYDGFDLFVRPDSGITSICDLEGEKVPVGSRKGLFELGISYLMEEDGCDPSKVEWIQMVAAPSLEAFKAGRLNVAGLALPYSADAEKAGGEVLTRFTAPLHDGAPMLMWVAGPGLAEDADRLAEVQRAIVRTNEAANADPDGTVAAAADELGVPVELFKNRPEALYFPTSYDQAALESLAERMVHLGSLDSVPDIAASFAALPDAE